MEDLKAEIRLKNEIREIMQEMLLKKNLSSDEEFQHWWINEGNERRYFALQGRLEELEEEERRKKLLSSYYMNAMEDWEWSSEEEEKNDM